MSISFLRPPPGSPLFSTTRCEPNPRFCGQDLVRWLGFFRGFLRNLLFDCRKGDYYRYLAEFKAGNERKEAAEQSQKAYQVYIFDVPFSFFSQLELRTDPIFDSINCLLLSPLAIFVG